MYFDFNKIRGLQISVLLAKYHYCLWKPRIRNHKNTLKNNTVNCTCTGAKWELLVTE
jgi:hypothetical protein